MNKIYSSSSGQNGLSSKFAEYTGSSRNRQTWNTRIMGIALLFMISLFGSYTGFAQSMANYSFSTVNNGSLQDLTTGSTSLLLGNRDDAATTVQAIGFDFYFMGMKYTHFSANSNGQVRLHASSTETAIAGGNVSSFSLNTVTLAPMAGDNEVNDGIKMKLIGTSPNRKLVVEWSQFYVQYANITNAGNMQLILSETTSAINFVYGEIFNSTTSSQSRSVFISSGNTATSSGYVTVGETPAFTVAAAPVVNVFAPSTVVALVASPLIANLGSAANGSRLVFQFAPINTTVSGDVTTFTTSAVTETGMTLNWIDNATNEGGFLVTRATDAAFTQNVVSSGVASTTTAGTGTSYTSIQTGISPGTTYFYKVQATVEGGISTGITGSQVTTSGATYYWTGATGGNWGDLANWNTAANGSGTAPAAWTTSDVHVIDGAGTTTGGVLSIVVERASFTVGQVHITNNTELSLESSATTTRTITISGGPNADFILEAGSTLNLTSATKAIAFVFSGSGNLGTIAGTYNASGSTSNVINATGGTGTLVTVSGSITNTLNSSSGAIVGSVVSLKFVNGSNYVHSNSTTINYIPTATWELNATATLNGNTTGTSITSGSTSLGNLVINTTLSTATLSAFTSNSREIKGNLTINSTGTGKFRAVTTGVLQIFGNLIINAGTFEVGTGGSAGVVVLGNTTVASGAVLDLGQSILQIAGNVVNNGSVLSSETTTTTSNLNFLGETAAQTLSGTGTFTGRISNLGVNNVLGLTISTPVLVQRINLIKGNVTGASNITIGTGLALSGAVQIGSSANTTPGGSFDAAPTYNLGTGAFTLLYSGESTARTTGFEVPTSRKVTFLNMSNPNGLTLAGGSIEVSNILTLTNGIVTTTAANHIIHGSATTAGTLSGGSAISYINGPIVRTINNANTANVLFPVGKSNYSPISLAPTTTAVSVMKAEAFDSNTGTASISISNLAANRRWEASIVSGAFTDTKVILGDALIGSTNIPVQAPTAAGVYTSSYGSTANFTAGTPNQIESLTAIASADFTGFLSFANASICMGTPTPGNTIASSPTICLGDEVTLSLQNTTDGSGVTYQWQSSADGVTFADIAGATEYNYVAKPNQATYYRANVTCSAGPSTGTSTAVQVTFTNTVASTTAAARCGVGSVTLGATPSAGATINWYANPVGGVALASGASFTTPSISATTTYYAAAEVASPIVQGTVGTGTALTSASSNNSVFCNYWATGWRQMVYTAAELTAAGLSAGSITALTFNIATLPDAGTVNNFAIRLGATSNSVVTGFTTAGLSNAFGPANYTPVVGLNTITLTTPYVWDGSSNILIDIREDGQYDNANSQTYYTTTVANTVAFGNASGSAPDSSYYTSNPTATLSKLRPNVVFTSQPSCSSPRVAVVATISTPPVLTINTGALSICNEASSSAVTVTSTLADFDTYTWSPATGVSGNSTTGWIFNPTVTTTYTLTATQTSGSLCAADATLVVTVNPLPSISVISSAASICATSTDVVTLSTGLSSSMDGACLTAIDIWPTATYTPATLDGVTVNTVTTAAYAGEYSNVNVLNSYSYTFTSSIATDYITIGNAAGTVVYAAGLTPLSWTASSDQVIRFFTYADATCGAESISRTRALTGKLTSSAVWSPSTNLFLDAATTMPYLGTAEITVYAKPTSTTTYTATATTAAGCSASANTTITVNTVTAPTASAQSFCTSGTVADLVATTGTNLKWYAGMTGGSALASTTTLVTGTTYYVSQTVAGCESTRTSVAVTVNVTDAPTASAQTFCGTASVADLVATTGTNLKWYADMTGGSALVSTTALATGTYYVSQTVAGCESTRTSVAVTVNVTVAPTASAQTFCNSASVASLVATTGTNLQWYADMTGGSALVSTTALATGTYYVSQTVAGCESTRTSVTVTVNVTAVPTASAQTFCNTATVANLVATTGTNLKWYADMTGGSALVSTTALATGTYYASQTIAGCESTRTSVAVTVNVIAAPTGNAVQDFTTGQTLANFTVVGQNIIWYSTATGNTVLPSSTVLASGVTYYASQTVNGCESTPRLAVTAGSDLKTSEFEISNLRYYPNPVQDILTVDYSGAIEGVQMYNMLGQQVYFRNTNSAKVTIDMGAMATGNYILQVTVKGITKNVKVIKK